MTVRANREKVPEELLAFFRSKDPDRDTERFWRELTEWYKDEDGSWVAQWGEFVFPVEVTFVGATFSGDADFIGTTFSGDADFIGTTFAGDADFDGATFAGGAGFIGTTFSGEASFVLATFSQEALFNTDTRFMGDAHTRFIGDAHFAQARFNGDAHFDGATFSGDAYFEGVTFKEEAFFQRSTFEKSASFRNAHIRGSTWSQLRHLTEKTDDPAGSSAGDDLVTFCAEDSFVGADLTSAHLAHVDLKRADLQECTLNGADLANAILQGEGRYRQFFAADLRRGSFDSRTRLNQVSFKGVRVADLSWVM